MRRIWRIRRRRWRWIIKDRGRLSGTEGNHWRRRDILAHLENGSSVERVLAVKKSQKMANVKRKPLA